MEMWMGTRTVSYAYVCLMHEAIEVLASAENGRQSTASKMTVGIIAGVCTVSGLLLLLCGCYCYCCTDCCSGKQKKGHRRILPENIPPPASQGGGDVTNDQTPGPSNGTGRLGMLTTNLPPPDARHKQSVPSSGTGGDRRQSEGIPFSALADLSAIRRQSEDTVGYKTRVNMLMNRLPPPQGQRRESLEGSEMSASTATSSRTNDSTRTATSIGRT